MTDETEGQLPDWLRTEILYLDGNPDYKVPPSALMLLGDAADALDRLATLESAILTIIKSMNEYLPPTGGDKDRFINEVIGAVDNAMLVKALEGKK